MKAFEEVELLSTREASQAVIHSLISFCLQTLKINFTATL